jgi:hypothetical protein
VIAFALAVAIGQTVSATGALRVPYRAAAHGFAYGYGFSEPRPHSTMGAARHTARRAVAVIRAEHAFFHVTFTVPHATPGAPVQVTLWRGRERILDERVRSDAPHERYVAVPHGEAHLMLELAVSRTAGDGTGVVLAGNWLREVPPGIDPALVVP